MSSAIIPRNSLQCYFLALGDSNQCPLDRLGRASRRHSVIYAVLEKLIRRSPLWRSEAITLRTHTAIHRSSSPSLIQPPISG